jgi:hypothetical protein
MAKSNWKGTSGWGAINDPTGSLRGRVLVASAGLTATNEDYLTTIVGTSTAFTAQHYSVYMDYAFPNFNETHPMIGGSLGLIARSGNFNGDPASAYDAYRGELNVEEKKVKIIRKNNDAETVLISADMPNSSISRGKKHTMEFRCYGTTTPTLQLLIDSQLVANIGDTSASKLITGYAGIHVRNGTSYVDTFTIRQYTSDGQEPSLWTPMQITGVTLSAWYIGDEGVTATGATVTAWADQSINTNNLSTTGGGEGQLLTNNINNHDAIEFDGSGTFFRANNDSTLDMNSDGVSIFAIVSTKTYASTGGIFDKDSSYRVNSDTTDGYKYTNGTNSTSTSSFVGVTDTYHLLEVITDKDNDTGVGGLFVDGTSSAGITFGVGANNTSEFLIGKNTASNFFTGSIAEVVLIKGECTKENRELVEGYLANKYATSSRLPSNHPYRNYAPIQQ